MVAKSQFRKSFVGDDVLIVPLVRLSPCTMDPSIKGIFSEIFVVANGQ